MFDGAAFGREIVASVKDYLERTIAPVLERLAKLESDAQNVPKLIDAAVFNLVDVENVESMLEALPKPENGRDADPERVAPLVIAEAERILSGWERPQNGIDGRDGSSGADGKDGRNGKDADPEMIATLVRLEAKAILGSWDKPKDGMDGVDGKDGRDGVNGKDVEFDEVAIRIRATAETILADWPQPQDGRNGIDGKDGVSGVDGKDGRDGIDGKDGASGVDGRDGVDGKSVDMELVAAMVKAEVERIMEAWPRPQDGKDGRDGIDGKDGRDGIDGKDGAAGLDGFKGEPGMAGLDGIGLAGTLQDKDGNLVLTMSDGTIFNVGRVQGLDGIDGKDGMPGRDGFGFDDMTEELDEDGRTLIRRFARDGESKEFRHTFNVVLDRGVWKEGIYQTGDGVTWGGQYYIAQAPTTAKPMTSDANGDWRLAVKKGRDGKDGIVRTIVDKPIVKVT